MKRIKLLFIILLLPLVTFSAKLSDSSTFSLLTASPGKELYSTFGHCGLRLNDPELNIDYVFNYGTFDFNTPNFNLKFARGKLDYCLAIEWYTDFLYSYNIEERSVVEEILNLSQNEKQRLFELLQENYRIENRYYKYDFFYDNCATRIRDILNKAVYPDTLFRNIPEKDAPSIRFLLAEYLVYHPWEHIGLDIIMGLPDDKPANIYNASFLPDYLYEFTAKAKRNNGQSLVSSELNILSFRRAFEKPFVNPALITGILILLLSVLGIFKRKFAHWFDGIYFTIISLIGLLICFMWFFTEHGTTKDNLNIIWAIPVHFIVVLFVHNLKWRKVYFTVNSIILFLLIVNWFWLPQQMHDALFPFILAIFVRSLDIAYNCHKELKKAKNE